MLAAVLFGLLTTAQVSVSCCVPEEFRLEADAMCGIGQAASLSPTSRPSRFDHSECDQCLACAAPAAGLPLFHATTFARDGIRSPVRRIEATVFVRRIRQSQHQARAPPVLIA